MGRKWNNDVKNWETYKQEDNPEKWCGMAGEEIICVDQSWVIYFLLQQMLFWILRSTEADKGLYK